MAQINTRLHLTWIGKMNLGNRRIAIQVLVRPGRMVVLRDELTQQL